MYVWFSQWLINVKVMYRKTHATSQVQKNKVKWLPSYGASTLLTKKTKQKNAMWLQEVYFKLLQNFSPQALCLAADDTKKNVIYSSYFVVASSPRVGVFVCCANIFFLSSNHHKLFMSRHSSHNFPLVV